MSYIYIYIFFKKIFKFLPLIYKLYYFLIITRFFNRKKESSKTRENKKISQKEKIFTHLWIETFRNEVQLHLLFCFALSNFINLLYTDVYTHI